MTSHSLREVQKFEENMEKTIAQEERPVFHLTPRVGWMNDPNGFSYYKGEYHLFYQYNPYDTHWGPMHWGHAVSKDLLNWSYLPAVLAPDTTYDGRGCFSGSALELSDGRQLLMYTGVREEIQPDGSFLEIQNQCIATGDGNDYEKYCGNPVLDEKDLPEESNRYDFRDPKIWRKTDGTFCCVVGNRAADGNGRILLFSSPDGLHWKYEKILLTNSGEFGRMWECPDFFPLDGKQVLFVSPQDMRVQGYEYVNGNGTVCFIGEYNEETDSFIPEHNQAIDYGIDFYAPQTVLAPDGRRIMIGWMQNWDTCNQRMEEKKWYGQMCLPRELSIKDGRLIQKPVRELEIMHSLEIRYENVSFTGMIQLDGISGRKIDMELSIRPAAEQELYDKFAVRFAQNNLCHTDVIFRPQKSVVKMDRTYSGFLRAIPHERKTLVRSNEGQIKLRIILDRYSAEVFINDGEQVMTMTIYTDQAAEGISFLAEGQVVMDVVKYDLTGKQD